MLKVLVFIYTVACVILLTQAHNKSFTDFADAIKLSYTDGIWQCDSVICPRNTYGCVIVYDYTSSPKYSYEGNMERTNICYMENGVSTFSFFDSNTLKYDQKIRFNVTSYLGALSVYGVGFSSDYQIIEGTVAPNGWPAVQRTMTELMNSVKNTPSSMKN